MPVMRQRQVVRLDLPSGTVTARTQVIADDAGVSQRFAELRASLPDVDGERLAWVSCDGCPARAAVDCDDPQLPAGWVTTPAGEFCPACRSAGREL